MENKVLNYDEFTNACNLCSTKEYHIYDRYNAEDEIKFYNTYEVISKDEGVHVKETLKITETDDEWNITAERITDEGTINFPKDKMVRLTVRQTELTYDNALRGSKPTIKEVTYVYDPKKNAA